MMKMPVGGWSAPGPVTLYRSERLLSRSDLIYVSKKIIFTLATNNQQMGLLLIQSAAPFSKLVKIIILEIVKT